MIQQEWLDKEGLKIIKDFPVLWQGWECDSTWYLCETQSGNKVLVETNHGSPFISTVDSLQEKISEYKEALAETEEIVKALTAKEPLAQPTTPCYHCNGECCFLERREGTARYSQLSSHGQGVHYCKYCKDGIQQQKE